MIRRILRDLDAPVPSLHDIASTVCYVLVAVGVFLAMTVVDVT